MRDLFFTGRFLKQIAVCLLILVSIPGSAQESILTASGNATGEGGTASYSVGQVVFRTVESASGTVTEGVQQPYEILFMTGVEDDALISLDCIVFPNPAMSEVRLKIDRPSLENYTCQLSGSSGAVFPKLKIEAKETAIDVKDLPAGIYILTLFEYNMILATWKVIKN